MRKQTRFFSFFFILFLALTSNCFAADQKIYSGDFGLDGQDAQAVTGGMSHKLVRGIANVATGFGELPKQIILTTEEEGALMGSTVGPIKGLGMSIARTLAGVYDTVFFFLPIPGFYNPIIDPVYVWQKEE